MINYSYEYSLYGDKSDMSSDFVKLCYKKYFEWKTDRIKSEKEEVDKKLKAFNKVLGKSFERDMPTDFKCICVNVGRDKPELTD